MTNRTINVMRAIGWQGGTVHMLSKEFGFDVHDFLYKKFDTYLDTSGMSKDQIFDKFSRDETNLHFWVSLGENGTVNDA